MRLHVKENTNAVHFISSLQIAVFIVSVINCEK